MKTAIAAPADDGRERELARLRAMLWISLQAGAERERILLDVALGNLEGVGRSMRVSAGRLERANPHVSRWLRRVAKRLGRLESFIREVRRR